MSSKEVMKEILQSMVPDSGIVKAKSLYVTEGEEDEEKKKEKQKRRAKVKKNNNRKEKRKKFFPTVFQCITKISSYNFIRCKLYTNLL